MKILALDTSSKFLCCGLDDDGRVGEYTIEAGTRMSECAVDSMRRILDASGVSARQIGYFACGIGPGSFTGTRIGVAAVKGMAWALKKPIVDIVSLDILAEAVPDEGVPIVVAVDAKRGLVYTGVYVRRRGQLRRRKEYALVKKEKLGAVIPRGSIVLGDAIASCRDSIVRGVASGRGGGCAPVRLLDSGYWYPRPDVMLRLARRRIAAKNVSSAFDVEPMYLYPKECQVQLRKK